MSDVKVVHGNQSDNHCICDLVPKGVHNKGVENKADDTLKLAVFLECAQC